MVTLLLLTAVMMAMFTIPSVLALTSDHRDSNMMEMCQKDPGACVGNGNDNDNYYSNQLQEMCQKDPGACVGNGNQPP